MKKKRIIFFSGKGGVGKTTTAAATALRCAELGYRTIIVSTDPAHSLSDVFNCPIGATISPIMRCLDGIEIDPYQELDTNWGNIRDFIANLMSTLGAEEAITGELAIIPGMDNVFSLLRIKEFHDHSDYEVIIVDMAPTGESLRLLSLPQIITLALKITRYLEKYIITPVIRPASRVSKSLRAVVASEEVARSWEGVLEKLLAMKRLLESEAVTSTRLVLHPEKMVIAETQRALTYLNLFGMLVDTVMVNRVMPKEAENSYFREWYRLQQHYLSEIHKHFAPIPIAEAPYFKEEMIGQNALRRLATTFYGDQDPSELMYSERPIRIIAGKAKKIAVQIPFMDTSKPVQLSQRGNELMIQAGPFLKSLIIPDSFSSYQSVEADYKAPWLEVTFRKRVSR